MAEAQAQAAGDENKGKARYLRAEHLSSHENLLANAAESTRATNLNSAHSQDLDFRFTGISIT